MCVVSMIIDHQTSEWQRRYPKYIPAEPFQSPIPIRLPTQQELEEFRRLLDRAREYDKRNNEPECEMDSKKRVLKELAEKLGVDISFIDNG